MKFKSSTRIDAIVSEIIPGREVWDFCCDHGLIGLHAMRLGLSGEIHFVDPVEGIIRKLRDRLLPFFNSTNSRFTEQISLSAKDDWQNLSMHLWQCKAQMLPISVKGTVVIAGVGAELTLNILEALERQNKLKAEKIILCPNKDENFILERQNVLNNPIAKYRIEKTFSVFENQKEKNIFVFVSEEQSR